MPEPADGERPLSLSGVWRGPEWKKLYSVIWIPVWPWPKPSTANTETVFTRQKMTLKILLECYALLLITLCNFLVDSPSILIIRDRAENRVVGFRGSSTLTANHTTLCAPVMQSACESPEVLCKQHLSSICRTYKTVLVHHMLRWVFFSVPWLSRFKSHGVCSYVVLITTICQISWQIFALCLKQVVWFIDIVVLLAAKWISLLDDFQAL